MYRLAHSSWMLRPQERDALQLATGAVVAVGDDGLIAFVSPAALELLGWDGTLLRKPLSVLVPGRLKEAHHASFRSFTTSLEPRHHYPAVQPALTMDGRERDVQIDVAVFRRPDTSLFFCSTMAPVGRSPPSLGPVHNRLVAHGYVPVGN